MSLTSNRPVFRPGRAHVLFIILVAVVFYGRTLDNYWIKDDLVLRHLTDGGMTVDWPSYLNFLWPSHMTHDQYWRPLPMLSGFVDYVFWGPNPAGYHILNTLLHALVGVGVYFLANRLTGFRRPVLGFVAALAFVVSPIHPEAVIWITQRMVLSCALFSVVALLLWLKAVESGRHRHRWTAFVAMALATLCKEVGAVLPATFFFLDLYFAPAGTRFARRTKVAVTWAFVAAGVLAVYCGIRYLLFGRLDITYGELEPMEYARNLRVFERLPDSLRHCLLPVNAAVFPDWARLALQGAMIAGYGLALLRAATLIGSGIVRVVVPMAMFLVTSFVPTLMIYWVDENLFNGRFFYQPSVPILVVAAVALWLPRRSDTKSSTTSSAAVRSTIIPWLGSTLLVVSFAISLAGGLRAFEEGADQVRGVQQGVLAEMRRDDVVTASRERGTSSVAVVLNVPSYVKGVPTLETSLEHAVRPPLASPGIDSVALIDIHNEGRGWLDRLQTMMETNQWAAERLVFLEAVYHPPGARHLFGPGEPAIGDAPPTLFAPADGAVIDNRGDEPVFRFRPADIPSAGGAGPLTRFVLEFETNRTPEPIRLHATVGKNAGLRDGVVEYRLSDRDARNAAVPDIWASVLQAPLDFPIAAQWRVEAHDDEDRLIGVSASRRIVVFNGTK